MSINQKPSPFNTTLSWSRKRARLNHHWLRNQVIPAISKLNQVVAGLVYHPDYPSEFLDKVKGWDEQIDCVNDLINSMNMDANARTFAEEYFRDRIDEDELVWVLETTNSLWKSRSNAEQIIKEAHLQLENFRGAYTQLLDTLNKSLRREKPQPDDCSKILAILDRFLVATQKISNCLGKMPPGLIVCNPNKSGEVLPL